MALDGRGADLLEQVGLGCGVVVLDAMIARQSAKTLEIARHAPAQRGPEFSDVLVLERRCGEKIAA